MLSVYLACLVFGGALVGLSLFSGFDADAEAGVDANGFDAEGWDADAAVDGDAALEPHGLAAVVQFFSFRNVVFFLAFFGLTGTVLTLLAVAPPVVALVSVSFGCAAASALHRTMSYLRRSESGRVADERDFEGLRGRVVVGVTRAGPGKISVNTEERSVTLLAAIAAGVTRDRFEPGEEVIIVNVESGVAQVAGEEYVH
jgi:membrane protein implicated in regulation of membrane protease activity